MVLTDVLKRWQVLRGKEAILCTGTDEHGMKIQQAAAKAGSEPKPFCDRGAEVFKTLAARAQISNDHFVRTTDPEHREAVEYAWHLLQERGYIYEAKHEGWYCVSDETFYPQSAVQLILEPQTGRKIMTSVETGKEVQWTSETNYHFRLSSFRQQLLDFYAANPSWIVPKTRMEDVIQHVTTSLEDLSISRPTERLTWGIRVPNDSSQTIYVWLDALLNYATKAGYPFTPGQENVGGWPADVHVIGKDIVRFHCIYWPAFLMALDLPLPKQILTHAHWTMNQQKMAKSSGNGVNPFFALDRFGVDTMRFYLAHDGGIANDADYSNHWIVGRYKKNLQSGLGNLASRVLRGKRWSVPDAIARARPKLIDAKSKEQMAQDQCAVLIGLPKLAAQFVDERLDPGMALRHIMGAMMHANKYLQHAAPWDLVQKHGSAAEGIEEQSPELDEIIYLCAETLRIVGILLQPYVPNKAERLLDMLGVDKEKRMFEHVQFGSDDTYGKSFIELGKGPDSTLFPPLVAED